MKSQAIYLWQVSALMLVVSSAAQDADVDAEETATADDVRLPPTITQGPPRHVDFAAGQEITLPCVATGIPEPEFEWFHDGAPFDKNTPGIVWNKGSMTISQTTANYEGEWQCFAKNQYGKSMSAYVEMIMNTMASYPPGQTVKPYTASQGEMLKLTCDSLKSVPEPTYTWSVVKDEDDKSSGDPVQITERIQIDDYGNLLFANVIASDHRNGALYKCNLYNPALLITVGGSLSKIDVAPGTPALRNPTLEYQTSSPLIGLRSKSVSLKCIFAGNDTPKVQWKKVGGSLPFGRHTFENAGSTLIIDRIEDEDQGEYECVGRNSNRETDSRIQLVVHCK